MDNNTQQNGNTQLNQTRNEFNDKVRKKKYLGDSMRIFWNDRRRFRTI